MITAANFKEQWGPDIDGFAALPPSLLQTVFLAESAKTFLRDVGLPRSPAPYLTFHSPDEGTFASVAEEHNLGEKFSHSVSSAAMVLATRFVSTNQEMASSFVWIMKTNFVQFL